MLTETVTSAQLPINRHAGSSTASRFESSLHFHPEIEPGADAWAFLTGYDFVEEPDGGFEWLVGLA